MKIRPLIFTETGRSSRKEFRAALAIFPNRQVRRRLEDEVSNEGAAMAPINISPGQDGLQLGIINGGNGVKVGAVNLGGGLSVGVVNAGEGYKFGVLNCGAVDSLEVGLFANIELIDTFRQDRSSGQSGHSIAPIVISGFLEEDRYLNTPPKILAGLITYRFCGLAPKISRRVSDKPRTGSEVRLGLVNLIEDFQGVQTTALGLANVVLSRTEYVGWDRSVKLVPGFYSNTVGFSKIILEKFRDSLKGKFSHSTKTDKKIDACARRVEDYASRAWSFLNRSYDPCGYVCSRVYSSIQRVD